MCKGLVILYRWLHSLALQWLISVDITLYNLCKDLCWKDKDYVNYIILRSLWISIVHFSIPLRFWNRSLIIGRREVLALMRMVLCFQFLCLVFLHVYFLGWMGLWNMSINVLLETHRRTSWQGPPTTEIVTIKTNNTTTVIFTY